MTTSSQVYPSDTNLKIMSDEDVLVMSWICPYELNALGYSSFCDVFTLKEWRKFNYARDLASYYGSGYSPSIFI